MGRPLKNIDVPRLIELASKGHTSKYIADVLGVSDATIRGRFLSSLRKGRALRDSQLRAKQFEVAMGGNSTMLIWLGKQHLGQKDKVDHEHTGKDGGPIAHTIRFGNGSTEQ